MQPGDLKSFEPPIRLRSLEPELWAFLQLSSPLFFSQLLRLLDFLRLPPWMQASLPLLSLQLLWR